MPFSKSSRYRVIRSAWEVFPLDWPVGIMLTLLFATPIASANEGFTDPYRTIHVAASESGIVSEVPVTEGTVVKEGQPLVKLDVDVHEALLAIAKAGKEAHGHVDAAEAEVALRKQRLETLDSLRTSGHARQEEVDRAQADLAIAKGKFEAAREQQKLRQLEFEKVQLQIRRRTIRAPQAGVVTNVFKQVGEFTAPNDPDLVVVVQLDPLAATFDVLAEVASNTKVGDSARVKFTQSETTVDGVVEYVSPVMDAESGTIAVKVRIPNPDGVLQSGQACTLETP